VAKISVVSNTAGGKKSAHADPQVLTIPLRKLKPAQIVGLPEDASKGEGTWG
jgi:hypothetical protein